MNPDETDEALVKSACRGDVDSFAQLYRRYFAAAVGIAYCVLGDHGLAEDAAQESFAEACRALVKLRDGRKFPHWLGTICRRISQRMAKSNIRRRAISWSDQDLEVPVNEEDSRKRTDSRSRPAVARP